MNGNGQWKWIAGILAALMVGGLPGCVAFFRAPTRADFDDLQRQQQATEVKLAVLVAQNKAMLDAVNEARRRIIALQTRGG